MHLRWKAQPRCKARTHCKVQALRSRNIQDTTGTTTGPPLPERGRISARSQLEQCLDELFGPDCESPMAGPWLAERFSHRRTHRHYREPRNTGSIRKPRLRRRGTQAARPPRKGIHCDHGCWSAFKHPHGRMLYRPPLAYLARGDSRVGRPLSPSYISDTQVDVATQTEDIRLAVAVRSRHQANKPAAQKESSTLEKSPQRPFLNFAAWRRLRRSQMAHTAYHV